jgi:tRNA(Ile)-lysidine synthase
MQSVESSEFVAHVRRTFPDLIGQRVLVALSGGPDSTALLHLLARPELGLRLEAAHVHHRLRGAEADGDAEFCRRLCGELDLTIAVLELPTDDQRPGGGEAAWRRRRYRALVEHAARRGIRLIATGHHRDDVAEGVLLQLLRGAGPRAMSGIARRTPDGVIRPLLPWRRADIEEFLVAGRHSWREDSSNSDLARLRNRVRHVLLPELETVSPALRGHLVRLAATLAEDEACLADEVRRRAPFADPWDPDGGVAVDTVGALPPALRSRWLHGQVARLGIGPATRRQLDHLNELLDSGRPRSVALAGRWRLRSAGGRLWAEPPTAPDGRTATLEPDAPVELGLPGWWARLRGGPEPDPGARWSWRPRSDGSELTIRPPAAGESVPDTVGGRRSVRRLLAENLPRHLRPGWPVFCENGMIYWIPGVWQRPGPAGSSNRVVEVIHR